MTVEDKLQDFYRLSVGVRGQAVRAMLEAGSDLRDLRWVKYNELRDIRTLRGYRFEMHSESDVNNVTLRFVATPIASGTPLPKFPPED